MTDPFYGYWTMFGPDSSPDPTPASPDPTPPAPAPVYHSVITGTFDPTPAEIVAAAAASGNPVPSGMDPVEYSRMMSGLPPISLAASIPISPTTGAVPWIASPSSLIPSMSMPSGGPSSGISGSPITAAMKAPSFDGGGGILCDPITGKCPQYR